VAELARTTVDIGMLRFILDKLTLPVPEGPWGWTDEKLTSGVVFVIEEANEGQVTIICSGPDWETP
jgi:hypothetical protein